MKRLGPELKMPSLKASELKPPQFLVDLYWDLWDRRLLPVIGLIVVAIAATPFLLGGSAKQAAPPLASVEEVSGLSAAETPGAFTVAQAEPGLRDYHKRLAGRTPTDPFIQPNAVKNLKNAQLGLPGESSTTAPVTTTTGPSAAPSELGGNSTSSGSGASTGPSPSTGPSTTPAGGGAPPSGGVVTHHVTIYTKGINVRLTRWGGKQAEDEAGAENGHTLQISVKKEVRPLTPLPGEKAPVVAYMGPSAAGKVLLLVSNKVRAISGEGNCVLGKVSGKISPEIVGEGACQLLEVKPGFPTTFVFGFNEVHYMIKVLAIERIVIAEHH